MVKKLVITTILFISHQITSQNTFHYYYLDENNNEIDYSTYQKKCNIYFFKCLDYETDTLVLKKVLYKYQFGKLTNDELSQIKAIAKSDYNMHINNDETIVVKFRDTIESFSTKLKRYEAHVREHESRNIKHSPFNKKIHLSRTNRWAKEKNKCIKRLKKKYPISFLYVFNVDKGGVNDYTDFKWLKDKRNIFKNRFFEIIYNYNLLIIKPDGQYFMSGGHLSDKNFRKLIEDDNWSQYINEYNTFKNKYPVNGYGIFRKPTGIKHISHCF